VFRRIFGPKRDEVMEEGENCKVRSSLVVLVTKYDYDDQIKQDKTDEAWRDVKCYKNFGWKILGK
jgi:hypothetical protein